MECSTNNNGFILIVLFPLLLNYDFGFLKLSSFNCPGLWAIECFSNLINVITWSCGIVVNQIKSPLGCVSTNQYQEINMPYLL